MNATEERRTRAAELRDAATRTRRWCDRLRVALDHPSRFPLPDRVAGMPTDDDLLAVLARRPALGRATLARHLRYAATLDHEAARLLSSRHRKAPTSHANDPLPGPPR